MMTKNRGVDQFFCFFPLFQWKQMILTLPEPEILSNEVDPKIVNMEDGLLVDIDKAKINQVLRQGKNWSYNQAIESGILDKAMDNSDMILKTIFQPIVAATDQHYKVVIKFKSSTNEQTRVLIDNNKMEQDFGL